MRRFFVLLGLGAAFVLCLLGDASAQKVTVVHDCDTVRVTHGDFQRLPDAGWAGRACGYALKDDGGVGRSGCARCESSTFNGLTSACMSALQARCAAQ